jgi:hypothetical protein
MTENVAVEETTVEAPETEVEAEETEAVEPESELFDLDAVDENATDPISVFFAQTKPLYNKLVELSSTYKALSNTDDAVEEFLKSNTDPKVKAIADHRAELVKAIADIDAKLVALANDHIANTIGNGKTPDSIKKEYQDTNAALSDLVNPLRPMFVFMGIVSEEKPEATADNKRPRSTFKSNGTPQGDDFIKLLNRPGISGGTSQGTGEGKLIREWWAANAGTVEGLPEYQKQGKLPDAVKQAYTKATAK